MSTIIRRVFSLLLLGALAATGGAVLISLSPTWPLSFEGLISPLQRRVRVTVPTSLTVVDGAGVARVELLTGSGAIDLSVAVGGEQGAQDIQFSTRRQATGPDEASARRVAESVRPMSRLDGDVLVLYAEAENGEAGASRDVWVDWLVRVPSGTAVHASSDFGDVRLRGGLSSVQVESGSGRVEVQGAAGPLRVSSRFGDVSVRDHQGAATITTTTGALSVMDADAGDERIRLHSEFGALSLRGAAGESVALYSSSGRIEATRVEADGSLTVETQFGDLHLHDLAADHIEAATRGGRLSLTDVNAREALTATSRFGAIDVSRVRSDRTSLESDTGTISLQRVSGTVRMESGSGDLSLTSASRVVPRLSTTAGRVRFIGSLAERQEESALFESEFGDVWVALPEDSNAFVALETRFGGSHVELRLKDRQLDGDVERGRLGRGGMALLLRSTSGDLWLQEREVDATRED